MVGEEAAHMMRSIAFSYYTTKEMKKISVKRITSPIVKDSLGKNVPNGLYDPSLGAIEQSDVCVTCGELGLHCPGHFGHIELIMPVYNPLLYTILVKIVRNTCIYCHHFKHDRMKIEQCSREYARIMKDVVVEKGVSESGHLKSSALTSGQFVELKAILDNFLKGAKPQCQNCMAHVPAVKSEGHGKLFQLPLSARKKKDIMIMNSSDKKKKKKKETVEHSDVRKEAEFFSEPQILLPTQVKKHLELLFENEKKICSQFWGYKKSKGSGASMFFLDVVAVTPSRFRPPNFVNNEQMEHAQNVIYGKLLEANLVLSEHIAESMNSEAVLTEKGLRLWMNLQNAVNELIDSTTANGRDRGVGIRQMLEKKAGLFRWSMMGKRVNHTCRSVISPDPYIAVNEIGIPPVFAMKLTYPERVTPWNVDRLRKNVENGPNVHPGATHIENEEGVKTLLQHLKPHQRMAMAKTLLSTPSANGLDSIGTSLTAGKIVYRHLQDGDILLCNRQPTLHKPGVMGHKARVIQGQRALRLHYANCSTYNADFDGDEMNVHFPQDELGRSEAYNIVNANQQYCVPTSGDPIRGLIQDHICSAALLTKRDTFFTKDEYFQLVYAACVPLPASRVSASKAPLTMRDNDPMMATVPPAIWKPQRLWTGKQVLTTILHFVTRDRPPFSFSRGVRVSGDYIGKSSEELNVVVQDNEVLTGIIDKAQFGKFGLVHAIQELYGADDAGHLLSVFSRLFSFYLQMHGFTCGIADMLLQPQAEEERSKMLQDAAGNLGLIVHGRYVGIEDMAQEEAAAEEIKDQTGKILQLRGDAARARLDMLMSSAMNAVTSRVNNALIPKGLLLSFLHNCLCIMTITGAKGGLVNFTQISTLLGQQELEGKRVPRMVSGKTLPCFQPYEPVARAGGFISDRFLTGLRPQEYYFHCMAGRDGLVDTAVKTAKSGYLQRCIIKNLECLKIAYDYTVRDSDGSIVQFCYGEDGVDITKSSCLANFELLSVNRALLARKLGLGPSPDDFPDPADGYFQDIPEGLRAKYEAFLQKCPKQMKRSLKLRKKSHLKAFEALLKHKYFSSLAAPGEPVGVLAGQSIGEPSTQMTLNTFHFAGRGEMNVTLGIPRLHEILTVASKRIKTPIMTCPLAPGKAREVGERFAAKLAKVSLADILEAIEVCAVPFHVHAGAASKIYKVKLRLYPADRYPPHLNLTNEEVEKTVKLVFTKLVQKEIEKEIKTLTQVSAKNMIQMIGINEDAEPTEDEEDGGGGKRKKKDAEAGEAVEDDDEDEDPEEGTDAERRRNKMTDEAAYDSDSEDEEVKRAVEEEAEEENEQEEDAIEDYKEERQEAAGEPSKPRRVKSQGTCFEMKFSTPQDAPNILLPNIVEKVLKGLNIRKVKLIEKCSVIDYQGNPDNPALQTDGVNFEGLWNLGTELDLNRLTSNDIYAMLNTYGVEAARATIVNEVQAVFGSYGISVNVRHLGLIADFMTFEGKYRPLNRVGITSNTSPLLKMSFETASVFLVDASLRRQEDMLETPSSRIVVGRPVDLGTGCFDLLQKTGPLAQDCF